MLWQGFFTAGTRKTRRKVDLRGSWIKVISCLGSRLLWLERPKQCTMQRTYPRTCGRTCRTCSRACERTGERVSVRASVRVSVRVSEAHAQANTHARKQEYANVRTRVRTWLIGGRPCSLTFKGWFWENKALFSQNHPLKVSEQGGRGIERVRKWDTHPLAHTYVRMHVRSLTSSLTRSLRSLARTLTRSPARSHARSPARSLAHPCVSWRSPGLFGFSCFFLF